MIESTGNIPLCLIGFAVVITVLREVRPSVLRRNLITDRTRVVHSLRPLIGIQIQRSASNRTRHRAGIAPEIIQLLFDSRSVHPVVGGRIDLRNESCRILNRKINRSIGISTRIRRRLYRPILTHRAFCIGRTRNTIGTYERILTAPLVKQTECIVVARVIIGSTEVTVHHLHSSGNTRTGSTNLIRFSGNRTGRPDMPAPKNVRTTLNCDQGITQTNIAADGTSRQEINMTAIELNLTNDILIRSSLPKHLYGSRCMFGSGASVTILAITLDSRIEVISRTRVISDITVGGSIRRTGALDIQVHQSIGPYTQVGRNIGTFDRRIDGVDRITCDVEIGSGISTGIELVINGNTRIGRILLVSTINAETHSVLGSIPP